MAKEKTVNTPPKQQITEEVKSTALATASRAPMPAPLISGAPAWLQKQMEGKAARGLEKAEKNDYIVPRITLCQALTPLVVDGKAKVGDIIDNVSGEIICSKGGSLDIIPVAFAKRRNYLIPIAEGGGSKCRSDDTVTARPGGIGQDAGGVATDKCESCVFKEWDDSATEEKDRKPKCTLFYDVLCLVPGRGYSPYVWSGKSTNIKVMKRFLTTTRQTNADMFALKFALTMKDAANGNLKFQQWDFVAKGFVDEPEYRRGEQLFKSMQDKVWEAAEDSAQTKTDEDTDAPF